MYGGLKYLKIIRYIDNIFWYDSAVERYDVALLNW